MLKTVEAAVVTLAQAVIIAVVLDVVQDVVELAAQVVAETVQTDAVAIVLLDVPDAAQVVVEAA